MAEAANNESTTGPWAPYEPSEAAPWNRERVVHLHRRAAFAAAWPQIERDLADGPEAATGRLLTGQSRTDAAPADFETMAATIGDAAQASGSPARLQAWWLYRMMFSPDPLTERLTLMWHNHFATSNRKVDDLSFMRQQNEIFRRHARAPFGELLVAAVRHPAMLVWLDADANRAGKPNENLGRELLELFTLGIGNYGEDDVKAAARALTGWTVADQTFRFAAARHDDGEISFLGTRGRLSGDDLLSLLPQRPATARRIAWRLCTVFFGEGVVDERSLAELANGLSERELDLNWAVETIVRSQLFFSPPNMRTRILGPIEFLVGAVHALGLQKPAPSTLLVAEWADRMGQELFYPPNVGGWPEGQTWLGSKSVIARANFAAALVDGRLWNPPSPPDLSHCLPADRLSGDSFSVVRALAELMWGAASADALEPAQKAVAEKPRDERLRAAIHALVTSPEAQLG